MMLQKLSSIKITFWGLGLLIISLLSGVLLTFDRHHAAAMKSLSKQLPLTWLIDKAHDDVILTSWFIVVCFIAGVFFIHVILCIITRLYRLVQNGFTPRQWMFFLIHVMFLLVMLCHGLSMITGYKYSDIQLFPGQSFSFENGLKLTLTDVIFVDDTDILKASYQDQRTLMTRDNIHRNQNYAHITLSRKGHPLSDGRIYMLNPLKFESIQVTLTNFFIPEDNTVNPIGVKLVISKNPVTPYFFGAYAAMIITLIGFIVMTWQTKIIPNTQLTTMNGTNPK